jgi:hypothetical protein
MFSFLINSFILFILVYSFLSIAAPKRTFQQQTDQIVDSSFRSNNPAFVRNT